MNKHIVSLAVTCVALFGSYVSTVKGEIIPTLLSTTSEVTEGEFGQNADFLLHFKVEAVDTDAYVAFTGITTNLFEPPGIPTYEWVNIYLYSSAPAVTGDFGQRYYQILEGRSEVFTYVATVASSVDAFISFGINSIYWNTEPSTGTDLPEVWNGEMAPVDWQAGIVFVRGNASVPEPQSAALAIIGWIALITRRKRR